MGVSGGAMGLLIGSASGAAWGCIPALLTFGLSIPVCAAVAGGTGLCFGASIGGGIGVMGGGVAGYGASCLLNRDLAQPVKASAATAIAQQQSMHGRSEYGNYEPEWVGVE